MVAPIIIRIGGPTLIYLNGTAKVQYRASDAANLPEPGGNVGDRRDLPIKSLGFVGFAVHDRITDMPSPLAFWHHKANFFGPSVLIKSPRANFQGDIL